MIYKFITDKNINKQIRSDMLQHIIDGDVSLLKDAEKTAITQIKNKLQERFDMAIAFPTIIEWNSSANFNTDDYTSHADIIYKAKQSNTNKQPDTSTDDWVMDEPRDHLLITYCVDIILYHLHSRINPAKMPTTRIDRYDEAMEWLTEVRESKETPSLTLLDEGLDDIQWGGEAPQDHYW